jgi:hypothetical protein
LTVYVSFRQLRTKTILTSRRNVPKAAITATQQLAVFPAS